MFRRLLRTFSNLMFARMRKKFEVHELITQNTTDYLELAFNTFGQYLRLPLKKIPLFPEVQ